MSSEEFKRFALELAAIARKTVLPYFATAELKIEIKEDLSPVTIADRAAEEAMRSAINSRYREHGIVGEEFGSANEGAEYVWYLDPIDGTKSFVRGCPLFGSLIALCRNGEPIIGVIDHPALDMCCIGDGAQTLVNGREVKVSDHSDLKDCLLLTSDLTMVSRYQDISNFMSLIEQVQLFRTWGDCYGYTLVASGFADIMADPVMNPWDLLALIPVIEGAGGKITSWDGTEAKTAASIVAAPAALHSKVIDILNSPK
ncbi:MAG: histidinol-phosphatase [Deltaproteobacteria bacterium]|nr:histidinol-phosphatase [Deltaproteobacteria bacterium]